MNASSNRIVVFAADWGFVSSESNLGFVGEEKGLRFSGSVFVSVETEMSGPGLQSSWSLGEDRQHLYNIAKSTTAYQNQQHGQIRRAQSDETGKKSSFVSHARREPEEPTKQPEASSNFGPVFSPLSNLERFLQAITPSVPAQYPSKLTARGWRIRDEELQPYFVLADLWEFFKEWSVYGAGVPLVLNESDCVVQYYVPYLSGIQIYGGGESLQSAVKQRRLVDDSDGDYFRDSSSEGSSDFEPDRGLKCSREHWTRDHPLSETTLRIDSLALSDHHMAFPEELSSDEGENGERQPLFEYFERDPPYCREPLADKISDLARQNPKMMTLRSCDLFPESWISVAWYPIYRIPTGPTLRDLDACFLTFHRLCTPMIETPVVTCPSELGSIPKIALSVFGLASYKFKGSLWTRNGGHGCQLPSLLQAADEMLRSHQVNLPDFMFFSRR